MTAMRRRRRHPSSSSPRSSRPLASLAAPVSATAATCLSLSLLLLLPLLPDPPCAEAALYVNPDPGSWRQGSEVPWDGEGVVAYPSEPAKFGREFDPAVTGRANLFLPPHLHYKTLWVFASIHVDQQLLYVLHVCRYLSLSCLL